MAEKHITREPERLTPDELSWWCRVYLRGLPACEEMEAVEGCAHIAAEIGDASVAEYRLRRPL